MQRQLRRFLVPVVATALVACGGDVDTDADFAVNGDTTTSTTTTAPSGATAAPVGDTLLDPERATREELTSIDPIDEALADAIIAGRPYEDMTEVDAILAGSLDEAERDQVYERLWKPIDLNTASDEEILLIPRIGDRMLHEFKEYRPYQAIAQFEREMGKYVDDEEVARMERYVEIR